MHDKITFVVVRAVFRPGASPRVCGTNNRMSPIHRTIRAGLRELHWLDLRRLRQWRMLRRLPMVQSEPTGERNRG